MEIVVYLIVLYVDSCVWKGFYLEMFFTYIYGDGFILRWSYREMVRMCIFNKFCSRLGISEGSMLPSTATGVVTMDPDLGRTSTAK